MTAQPAPDLGDALIGVLQRMHRDLHGRELDLPPLPPRSQRARLAHPDKKRREHARRQERARARTHRVIVFRQWWSPAGIRMPDPEWTTYANLLRPGRPRAPLTVTWHADCLTCRRSLGQHPTQASATQARAQHVKEHRK